MTTITTQEGMNLSKKKKLNILKKQLEEVLNCENSFIILFGSNKLPLKDNNDIKVASFLANNISCVEIIKITSAILNSSIQRAEELN